MRASGSKRPDNISISKYDDLLELMTTSCWSTSDMSFRRVGASWFKFIVIISFEYAPELRGG